VAAMGADVKGQANFPWARTAGSRW
jgi:hypothetical protein